MKNLLHTFPLNVYFTVVQGMKEAQERLTGDAFREKHLEDELQRECIPSFLKVIVLEESSREGNTEESEQLNGSGNLAPSHMRRGPLTVGRVLLPETGLHVCDPAECGRLPCPVPSHLNISVIEGKE